MARIVQFPKERSRKVKRHDWQAGLLSHAEDSPLWCMCCNVLNELQYGPIPLGKDSFIEPQIVKDIGRQTGMAEVSITHEHDVPLLSLSRRLLEDAGLIFSGKRAIDHHNLDDWYPEDANRVWAVLYNGLASKPDLVPCHSPALRPIIKDIWFQSMLVTLASTDLGPIKLEKLLDIAKDPFLQLFATIPESDASEEIPTWSHRLPSLGLAWFDCLVKGQFVPLGLVSYQENKDEPTSGIVTPTDLGRAMSAYCKKG